MCPSASKPLVLKWYGVAIDGKGFYAMDNVAPLPRIQPENLAYVLVDDPRASVEAIEDGLKKLVCEDWNWQVERLSETDFSVVFPNVVSLQLCKNAADLALPGSKIRIIVLDSICNPPGAPPPLSEVWTRVHGLPPCLLEADRLKAALEMVGKPVTVDAESLRLDPKAVRVLFLVHVPSFPKLSVSLFVNGKGAKVLIVPELSASDVGEGSPPLPPPQDKDKDKDKEDEEEKDQSDLNDSDSHWKRRKAKSSDPSPAQGAKDKAPADHLVSEPVSKKFARRKKPGVKPEKKKGASSVPIPKPVAVPLSSPASAPAPSIAQYGSNLSVGHSFAKKLAEVLSPVDDDLLDISSDDGPHVSPDKVYKLSADVREEIGWESPNEWDFKNETLAQKCKKLKVGRSFEGVAKKLDLASEAAAGISISKGKRSVAVAAQPSPSKSPSKVSKSGSASSVITSTTPTSSTRRSSRSKTQDSESMLAKAVRLQRAKDNPAVASPAKE
jgi:hypothetical protein